MRDAALGTRKVLVVVLEIKQRESEWKIANRDVLWALYEDKQL